MTLNELVKLTTLWTTGPWLNISTDNRTWIQQYVDRKYLLDGFSNYFGLHNEGIGVPFEVKNLKSALESPLAVQDKINK